MVFFIFIQIIIENSAKNTVDILIREGLDRGGGGSGIHYSLKFSPLFIALKFWVIH